MEWTKTALIEINERLREDLRRSSEESHKLREANESLARQCTELQDRLQDAESELNTLTGQFRNLREYVQRLRVWMLSRGRE